MMSTTASYGFKNAVVNFSQGTPHGYVATIKDAVGGSALATVTVYQPNTVGVTTDIKIKNADDEVLIDVPGDHNAKIEFQGDLDTGLGTVVVSFRDATPFTVNGSTLEKDHYALFNPTSEDFFPCSIL